MIESLELRLMLAVSATLDRGLLLIQGSNSVDVINIDLANGVVNVAINRATFMVPAAQVKWIRVQAGAGFDRVTITDAVNLPATLLGGGGDDYLRGGRAACSYFGDAGNDTMVGGAGADIFSGGLGIDTIDYSARIDNLRLSLDGKANDGMPPSIGFKGERDNIMIDVEALVGGAGNDALAGSVRNDTLIGGAGNDTLRGGLGDDLLVGGTGDDLLQGEDGNDILIAVDASNHDTLDGGNGYDSVVCDSVIGVRDTLVKTENFLSVLETA